MENAVVRHIHEYTFCKYGLFYSHLNDTHKVQMIVGLILSEMCRSGWIFLSFSQGLRFPLLPDSPSVLVILSHLGRNPSG